MNTVVTRMWDFTWMNWLVFFGSKPDEDPQEFLDSVQKVIKIMGIALSEIANLDTYQLQGVSYTCAKQWKKDRGADAGSLEWDEFVTIFADRFFQLELKEAKVHEFINMRQGSMSEKDYFLKFSQLVRYALVMVDDSRA